jgi:hypothetical protein
MPVPSAQKSKRVHIIFSMSFLPQASILIGLYDPDNKESLKGFKIATTFVRCQLCGTRITLLISSRLDLAMPYKEKTSARSDPGRNCCIDPRQPPIHRETAVPPARKILKNQPQANRTWRNKIWHNSWSKTRQPATRSTTRRERRTRAPKHLGKFSNVRKSCLKGERGTVSSHALDFFIPALRSQNSLRNQVIFIVL